MSTGLQELPPRRRRLNTTALIAALIVLGRILLASVIGYLAAFLLAAFTPLQAVSFFAIGPFAAAMAMLLVTERDR